MKLSVKYDFLPRQHSTNAAIIMDHFGLDFEQGQHVITDDLEVPIQPGNIVCWTGASGSGKSSLMRAAAKQLDGVINIDELELGSRLLIDSMPCPVEESLQILASCGLSEAQLMLRTPAELSDGQRYRFRLALAMAQQPKWILSDEFTATLDRTLAKVIAFNVRRVSQRTGIGFLLATTHEDVLEDLSPEVHVGCDVDGEIQIACDGGVAGVEPSERLEQHDGRELPLRDAPTVTPESCGRKKKHQLRGRTLAQRSDPV